MKTLKEIVKEAIRKYDEFNYVVYNISGASGKYSIAGFPKLEESLSVIADRTKIRRSKSKGYTDCGEGVLPIEIDDDTFVYMNVAIKTNSSRIPLTRFSEHSSLNKNGITPIGMTIIRKKEDGFYYFTQYDFAIAAANGGKEELIEILNGMKNNDALAIFNDLKEMRDIYRFWNDLWYIKERTYERGSIDFTYTLDNEISHFLNSDARLGQMLLNKYIFSEYNEARGDEDAFYIIASRESDNLNVTFPGKYEHLYALIDENKKKRRTDKAKNPKKGTVQARINEYSELLEDLDFNKYGAEEVVVQRVPLDDKECVVLRFIGKKYKTWDDEDPQPYEKYRVFVENSKLTFAEVVNDVWSTTTKTFDDYELERYSVREFDKAILKGTKLEYLEDLIHEIKEYTDFNGSYLLEVLGNNLFELIFTDENLKEIFLKAFIKRANNRGYYNQSLTSSAITSFGKCLNDEINTNKRIINLPKKKWFKFSKAQMKRIYEANADISALVKDSIDKYENSPYANQEYYNVMNLFSDLSKSSGYYYYERGTEGKYDIENISSLTIEEFDDYLEFLKDLFANVFDVSDYQLRNLMNKFETLNQKKKMLNIIKLCDGQFRWIADTINMIETINRSNSYTDGQAIRLPYIKEGLKTAQDVREWHDEIVEVQNQIEFERNKWARMKEEERYKKMQESYDKQQKQWKKYEMTDGEFVIKCPEKPSDLSMEGLALHHCVKSFVDKVANGVTTILFIRKVEEPDTPFYTMEVYDGKIRQVHGACNCNIPEGSTLEQFVDSFAEKHGLVHNRQEMNRMLA